MKRNNIILLLVGIIALLILLNYYKIITITGEQAYFAVAIAGIVGLVLAWQHLKTSAEETTTNNMPLYNMDEIQNTCLKQFEPGGTNKRLSIEYGKEYGQGRINFKNSATYPLPVNGQLAYYWSLYNVSSNEKALTSIRKLTDKEYRSDENITRARYIVVSNELGITNPLEAKEAYHNLLIMLNMRISPETDIDFKRYWTSNNQSGGGQFGGGMPNQQNRPSVVLPTDYVPPQKPQQESQ